MIHVDNISFAYNGVMVIHDISFSVGDGEFIGIIGPNGAGKSTLLKLLDRLIRPVSGRILLNGKALKNFTQKELARLVGFVQQDFTSAFNFTALEIVLMGRFPYQRTFAFDSGEDLRVAKEAMITTDCFHLGQRNFMTLSGGERQRVVLASALAQEPKILLLDEPTNALDLKHQLHFYRILTQLQRDKGITILSVTHDVNLASQFCGRMLVVKNGKILADGQIKQVLNKEILQKVYDTPLEIIPHPDSELPVILPGLKPLT